jgi:pyridoxamine 5'-phosphate oxidase
MSNDAWKEEVINYIDKTKFGVLGYVRNDGTPLLRSMGSFAPSGLDIYFSTRKQAAKVQAISGQKRISFLFEHDNQELNQWKNVLLTGDAELINPGPEQDKAVEILSNRSSRFKERIEKGELPQTQIFRLKTEEIEYLDYGKGFGHVQKITLQKPEPA